MELIPRHLLGFARDALETFPVVVVQGARQVGKSTFAGVLASARSARELTLDDRATADAAHNDPQAFVDQFPGQTLVIDEVQREPELLLAIKAAVDRDRTPGRFVLTGSSDLLRLERTPDSLAGRAVTLRLRGLSQGEIAGGPDDFVARLVAGDDLSSTTTTWQRRDYAQALAAGGYPEMLRLSGRLRRAWLDSYLERIIQRDARDVLATTQPERLRSLLRLVGANQAGELVKARLAAQAHIPASSITSYLDVLSTLFLVDLLPPWTPNLTRREIGRPKAMVADPALAMRLTGLTGEQLTELTGADHLGGLLEGFVVSELLKQQTWSDVDYGLFHYRDRNGLEVDVTIELGDGSIYGLEVKASQTIKSDHFTGLKVLQERAGRRFRGGIVLGTTQHPVQHGPGLWGLPISALWGGGVPKPHQP